MVDTPPLSFGPWWEVFRSLVAHGNDFPLMPAAFAMSHILQGGKTWTWADTALTELTQQVEQRCHEGDIASVRDRAHIVFEVLQRAGFAGDREHYEDPNNSYMDRVLERRRGLPIALSALAIHLARLVDVPMFGIGFPGHFIVGLPQPDRTPLVLDPYRGGQVLDSDALSTLAMRATGQRDGWRKYLRPANSRQIITRMLNNLVRHLEQLGQLPQTRTARRLLKIARPRT